MLFQRDSAILLHPTSLPGPHGIGDLGPAAHWWVDFVAESGCSYWQVLPLGPTGYGDSPYQCFSAFAGNPYLVSPEALSEEGLLDESILGEAPEFPQDRVDYGRVIPWKLTLLDRALDAFRGGAAPHLTEELAEFRHDQAAWLDDYALFMALKDAHGGGIWTDWPPELVTRDPASLATARERLAGEAERHAFRQFLFFRQWKRLRDHAHARGVRIIGDAPIFVAADSADVWGNPDLFLLDEHRRPTVVAGVPPDYFSETGQLWGNPLYDWTEHAATGYAWWIQRLRTALELVDVIRIDHFRGFVDYWEIPAGSPTAAIGRWVDGPGIDLFVTLREALGDLPIIAEDLGELHAAVPELRDRLGLPGMKILQFAFDGNDTNDFLPHLYPENCAVYTGTHDNDTTAGWFTAASDEDRANALAYLETTPGNFVWAMLRAAWASRAALAAAPLQDFLGLETWARMNTPGKPAGNWAWRAAGGEVTPRLAGRIAAMNRESGRGLHRA